MAYFIKEIKRYIWAEATNIRDFDRTFILFGKSCSGKSTLGNLLLWREEFQVHRNREAFGLTKVVYSRDAKLDPAIVYGDQSRLTDPLKIQILDQPGFNDVDFTQEDYNKSLMKCIAESRGEMCSNFLILINLMSEYLSPEECLTIINIAEVLSKSNYSFFPNAAIVFTYADKIDENMNGYILERELRNMIRREEFSHIKDLIDLVDGRYIFINGVDKTIENRNQILKSLFQLTKPNIKVYINGYNGFKGNDFKALLGLESDTNTHLFKLTKYDVEYFFNPDLNFFRKDKLELDQEITQALNRLSGIGKGVSVLIILISLEEMFNKEVYDLIINLPDSYQLGPKFKNDLWNYSCILFKGPSDDVNFLQRNIQSNSLLREFVERANSRYTLVNNQTMGEECSEKIISMILQVKRDSEGKTYLDSTVLAEMRTMIEESIEHRKSTSKRQITGGITNPGLFQVETESGPKLVVSANNFFWSRKMISLQIGYFILKTINPIKAAEFKDKYKHRSQVATEEFARFCLQ